MANWHCQAPLKASLNFCKKADVLDRRKSGMSVFFIIGRDLVELVKRAVRNINHLLDGGEMKT